MNDEIVLGSSLSKEILKRYPILKKKKCEISSKGLYIILYVKALYLNKSSNILSLTRICQLVILHHISGNKIKLKSELNLQYDREK